jgi:hypothetical protein
MIAAMREGLGRRGKVFPMSPVLLEFLLRSIGQGESYRRMSGSLVADPSALLALDWVPRLSTPDGLSRLMQDDSPSGKRP